MEDGSEIIEVFLRIKNYFSGIYSNKSAGVQSKALQMASKVESFIALALPVFKNKLNSGFC